MHPTKLKEIEKILSSGQVTRGDIEEILKSDSFEEEIVIITKRALDKNPYLVNPISNLLHLIGDPTHPEEKAINCSFYHTDRANKARCHYPERCMFKQEDLGCVYQENKKTIMAKFPRIGKFRYD